MIWRLVPPRAAKAAVPVWFLMTIAGMLAVVARSPNGADSGACVRRR